MWRLFEAALHRGAYSRKYDFFILKLSEFVVFNVAIIIHSKCQSYTLFASLYSVQAYTVFLRKSAMALI